MLNIGRLFSLKRTGIETSLPFGNLTNDIHGNSILTISSVPGLVYSRFIGY